MAFLFAPMDKTCIAFTLEIKDLAKEPDIDMELQNILTNDHTSLEIRKCTPQFSVTLGEKNRSFIPKTPCYIFFNNFHNLVLPGVRSIVKLVQEKYL